MEGMRAADRVAMGGGRGGPRVCTNVGQSPVSPRVLGILGARGAMREPALGAAALAQVGIDGELSRGAHPERFSGGAADPVKESTGRENSTWVPKHEKPQTIQLLSDIYLELGGRNGGSWGKTASGYFRSAQGSWGNISRGPRVSWTRAETGLGRCCLIATQPSGVGRPLGYRLEPAGRPRACEATQKSHATHGRTRKRGSK